MDIATILLTLGGTGLFLMAWAFAARGRRRARPRPVAAAVAAGTPGAGVGVVEPGFEGVARRVEGRMAALEAVQADLAARLEGGGAEDRLQAMAAQLLGLIRDKNATLETALAGLDQLRARMRTLEQMGSAAEARGLFEGLTGRLDTLESAQAAAAAALEAGLAARGAREDAPDPQVALMEQLTRLHAQKDAGLGTMIARLAPLETRLAAIEADLGRRAPAAAEARTQMAQDLARLESRLEARIEGVAAAQGAAGAALRRWRRPEPARWPRSPRPWRGSTPRRTPCWRASRAGSPRWRPSSPRATRRRRSTASRRGSTRWRRRERAPSRRSRSS